MVKRMTVKKSLLKEIGKEIEDLKPNDYQITWHELKPTRSQKSFYKKAMVREFMVNYKLIKRELYSYNTLIIQEDFLFNKFRITGTYSDTTKRHIDSYIATYFSYDNYEDKNGNSINYQDVYDYYLYLARGNKFDRYGEHLFTFEKYMEYIDSETSHNDDMDLINSASNALFGKSKALKKLASRTIKL